MPIYDCLDSFYIFPESPFLIDTKLLREIILKKGSTRIICHGKVREVLFKAHGLGLTKVWLKK